MVIRFKRPTWRNGNWKITTRSTSPAKRARTTAGHASRTTASESLQTSKDDGWSAAYELPAPLAVLLYTNANVPTKLWKHAETQEVAVFWETLSAPVPSKTLVRNFIHPVQFCIFPKRLSLQCPDDEILSGYEEDGSSIGDDYSAWVKADPASSWNATSSTQRVLTLPFGMHQTGNTLQPMRNTASIPTCPIA